MRKLVASIMVSIDGYIEDRNRNIDWHNWNAEMDEYMIGYFRSVDTILFGRTTFQLMEKFWPTELADTENPIIASYMNRLPKIVFSKTLDSIHWENSTLVHEDAADFIAKMKQKPGKEMVIFGGAEIISSLSNAGLIDEYRLIVNPLILGEGKALFRSPASRLELKLKESRQFSNGNLLLHYIK